MNKRFARILLALIFVALIVTPVVLRRLSAQRQKSLLTADARSALNRYGVYFEEVSHSAGVNFVHQAPTLDHKLDHIMPQVASMGAAVSIVDFDRDGWPDIYATNSGEGSKNALYRNQQDGTFKDVAGEVGLADVHQMPTGVSLGAVWGDYDTNGFEDVFLYKWGKPELFQSEGG